MIACRFARFRRLAAFSFVLLVPFLGGCVYLRLLQLKNQLADFDRHFAIDDGAGLKLSFKSPVLLDDDMSFLGMKTSARQRSGAAERWTVRWVKTPAADDPRGETFQQSLDFVFVHGKMTTVLVPERFFVFFPKNILVAGLRAMGRVRVDREKRSATTEVQDGDLQGETPVLSIEALRQTIGGPNEIAGDTASPEWRYLFEPGAECAGSGGIELTFTVDPAAQVVRRVRGRLIFGTFDFVYPVTPAGQAGRVDR